MFKKGGVFLSILLCATMVFAQDKTAEMFRTDNPNLMNLNEAKEYTGSPLVYIQGVKAPETANNDMEELQLKLFGTKDVRSATKDTLTLSDAAIKVPENQEQNLTFQTPFNKTIQSGFIPHVANFMTMIQILNQRQLTVSENVVLVNTKEDEYWTRTITLPTNTTAQITSYLQNGQQYPVTQNVHKNTLTFTSPQPLQLGPNQIVLKYNIENPFHNNQFNFQLISADFSWPIEKLDTLISFPKPLAIDDSKLLFGTNKVEIPDIYTQQSDKEANVTISVQRVIPPRAEIVLQMKFEASNLPPKENLHTGTFILWILVLVLSLYWILSGWLEKHRLNRTHLPKIKYPRTIATLAHQMDTHLNQTKWQQLIDFGQKNNWPLAKLLVQQSATEKHPKWTKFKANVSTFLSLMLESILGTGVLFIAAIIALSLAQETVNIQTYVYLILFCILGITVLYLMAFKPARKIYWQKKLKQLSEPIILTGLTNAQVRQIYPLFILTQKNEDWRKELIKTNPKVAQETHLYKEDK